MKKTLSINFFAMFLLAMFYQTTFAFGVTIFFNSDGDVINKAQYEVITSDRENKLSMTLRNGYNDTSNVWIDPIRLRKKRIEQWRIMRSHYSPDSFPRKIENPSRKNN